MAMAMKYTDDASSVDPASRANPAADQNCSNCALVLGNDGDAWRPCQIFPGKSVAAKGWCSVWAPKP
ncbi:MAG: high-potential iron-sulfur protein [Proteobacteria bacterium]|nr:high-potential iron-sulfur protein [Pseudomonadota bacterium]